MKEILSFCSLTPVLCILWTITVCLCCPCNVFPLHVINICTFCFTVRICFGEKFDFCFYLRAAKKRDCEVVTSSVLSFPRLEIGPNTTQAGSQSKIISITTVHCAHHFLCKTNPQSHSCFLEPVCGWVPGLPHHPLPAGPGGHTAIYKSN